MRSRCYILSFNDRKEGEGEEEEEDLDDHVGVVGEVLEVGVVEDPAAGVGVRPGHHASEAISAAVEVARPVGAGIGAVGVSGSAIFII